MFRINQKTHKIQLTKGDNAEMVITVKDTDGNERKYADDVITLTVRRSPQSEEVCIEKTATNYKIEFVPEDTKALDAGTYHYDIQLTTFGGKIYTIIPDSAFEVCQEVTR